jgi:hypothetical protein
MAALSEARRKDTVREEEFEEFDYGARRECDCWVGLVVRVDVEVGGWEWHGGVDVKWWLIR